jgi:glycosyltransferase involved in cell wall biosynthesis
MWSRGVDTEMFNPAKRANPESPIPADLPRPIFAYVGRVAVEKNVESFLSLDLPGSKVIVGDGPQRAELTAKFPEALFLGARFGDDLARCYADADVFVFPSLTDTFGLVILEAMASGTPVAAFVAPGPADIIPGSGAGVIGDDLKASCLAALEIPRADARAFAETFSWRACAEQFLRNLEPLPPMEKRKFWSRLRALRRKKPEAAG